MFNRNSISILNSNWEPIMMNLKVKSIPRRDELIYLNDKYHEVINVIHMIKEKQDIFVIIRELEKQPIISI